MKIEIEIPKELEGDYNTDQFEDFFSRAISDMNGDGMGGLYEQEIAKGLMQAFKESKVKVPAKTVKTDKDFTDIKKLPILKKEERL